MRHYDVAPIAEVAMNPTAFAQSLEQAGGRKVLVGLEFEVLVPRATVEKTQSAESAVPDWSRMIEDVTWADGIGMDKLSMSYTFEVVNNLVTTRNGSRLPTAYKKWNQTQFKPIVDPLVTEVFNKITNPLAQATVTQAYQTLMQSWQRSRTISYEYLEYKDIVQEILVKVRAMVKSQPASDPEDEAALKNAERMIKLLAINIGNLYKHDQIAGLNQKFYNQLAGTTVNNLGDLLRSGAVKFDMRSLAAPTNQRDLVNLWHTATGRPMPRRGVSGIDSQTRIFLQSQLKPMFGNVVVFDSYHEQSKNMTSWYVEPDGSLRPKEGDGSAEVVSPPLPAGTAIDAIKQFYQLATQNNFYTNNSTGLHINVSVPARTDMLKLLVFLGDEYVLKSFGRMNNEYAQSILKNTIQALRDEHDSLPRLGPDFTEIVEEIVSDLVDEHFSSVTYNDTYFSFRHAGGDYLNNLKSVLDTVGRFVRALIIASSPGQYQKEYLTKLYKLRGKGVDDKAGSSPIEQARQQIQQLKTEGAQVARVYFLKLNYGNISMDEFKKRIKQMYPGFSITFAPAAAQDVLAFTARGHGVSADTRQFAIATPKNLLVATVAVPGSIDSTGNRRARMVRQYIDLTDESAGPVDASDGYTKLGVYWGTLAARIEPGTPEMQQMIKDIIKNLKAKKK